MEEVKVSLEELATKNREWKSQLTNKNEQYVYQLERSLRAANVTSEKIETELSHMLPVLVEQQKKGMTARQLYGTVTECVENLLSGPKKDSNAKSPDWQVAVDGGLLVGGFFALIAGIMLYINPEQTEAMGLVTLIANFIAGGFALLGLSKVTPDINQPKGKRGYLRYIGMSVLIMIAWLIVVMASQLLPQSWNVVLPAIVYLVIGAVALGAKWYLKRTFDIRGGIL